MGAQDTDLVARLNKLNGKHLYEKVRGACHNYAIPNTVEAKISETAPENELHGRRLRWGQMDTFNQSIFHQRREAGHMIRSASSENIGLPAYLVPGCDL